MNRYIVCILVLIVLLVGGCGEPEEPVLTNYDLTRIPSGEEYVFVNSQNEPVLLIAGQEITPEKILNTPAFIEEENRFTIPGEYLVNLAPSMGKEEFKERFESLLYYILADTISDVLLYNSAKKEYGDNIDDLIEQSVEGEIKKRIQQFGGDEVKADEMIREKWYDRVTYKNLIKREILTQWYLSTQRTDVGFIPYRQLVRKYDSMKDEYFAIEPQIEFRLIEIIPSRLTLPDPNMDRQTYAQDLANEIYAKSKSGEDFGELAKEYSQGPRRIYGGLWDPVKPDSLAEPFDIIAKEAMKMNPGDISEPINTDSYIFIIKLENKQSAGYLPFEDVDVQNVVRKTLILEKTQEKALSRLDETINKQMGSFETIAFVNYCLEKIYKEGTTGPLNSEVEK